MSHGDYVSIKNEHFSQRSDSNRSTIPKISKGKHVKDVKQYFRETPERKIVNNEFICELCKKEFVDPRVLPCLHCFCIECLQKLDLEQNPRTAAAKQSRNERFQGVLAGYYSKEGSSKHEYVKLKPINEVNSPYGSASFYSLCTVKSRPPRLKCPICEHNNWIPSQGIYDFPPHYILQHRMLIKSLNKGEVCLLCDLCPSEIPATSRCTTCLLNLCSHCSKAHKQGKLFPDHELRKLKKDHHEGIGITKIRRQAMCPAHPENELKLYCFNCNRVTCTECRLEFHSGHNCESSLKAAQIYTCKIQESLERTRSLNKETSATMTRLDVLSQQVESKHREVQQEINGYISDYVEALEDHRKSLLLQATQIKNSQIRSIMNRQREVEKKAKDIRHTIKFGEELLKEGSDFEILSFAFYVLQRLEWCIKSGTSALSSVLSSCIGTLQFLPEEHAGTIKNNPVFGVVTTQMVSPAHCHITPEGVNALRNCREREKCELTLVTTDSNAQRLTHGAEGIEVNLKSKNGPLRQIPIFIVDHQNGVYSISFTPDVPGKMSLSISIRGVPIKGSPFSVYVRSKGVHKGIFHCCTFCSSGGNRSAVCGCGGRMPGGYQGCGHGYIGHPGQHHWSCCGNTLHKSECLQAFRNDGFYQLSL